MSDNPSTPAKPRYKYSIACCGRWEHEDVLEWVSYHKSVGFDHIYFVSNDDDPMPTFKVLTPFLFGPDPFVTFKHYPKPDPRKVQQADIYGYLLKNHLHETEWVAFIDSDEFFVFKGVDNVHEFMREYEDKYDAVYFNWLIFGHSGKMERDHESLLLSHTQREAGVDVHTKMLTRTSKIDADKAVSAFNKGGKGAWWHFWSEYDVGDMRQADVLHQDTSGYGLGFPKNALAHVRTPGFREAVIEKAYLVHYQFRSEADVRRRVQRGGSNTAVRWQQKVEDGSFKKIFAGRNAVWDTYLARYWLKHCRAAYDILVPPPPPGPGHNIALRKPNIQSSWHEPTPDDPKTAFAQGHANNGIRTGTYGFRTQTEEWPWWKLDLLDNFAIHALHIYNDANPADPQNADALVIKISADNDKWTLAFAMTPEIFAKWKAPRPLIVTLPKPINGRFIRISSSHPAQLQLDEVEVYGDILPARAD